MKLVRNRIPEVIERESSLTASYHIADPDELEIRLYDKLEEEIQALVMKMKMKMY